MRNTQQYDIIKMHNSKNQKIQDEIIVEYQLTIYLNSKEFVTLLCTPKSLQSLVVGFLYSERVIKSKEDIKTITIDEEQGKAYVEIESDDVFSFIGDNLYGKKTITTACGNSKTMLYNVMHFLNKIETPITIKPNEVQALIDTFSKKSELFKKTGGVHSCALCNVNEIILFEEDIGRHNALDKILGKALLENINHEDKIVLTTGRVSSEIMTKVAKRKIPILISRSAPTNVAIDMAKELGITLIGFARGQKMNIYSFQRLKGI